MKRFFALFLVLVLLPVVSSADFVDDVVHYLRAVSHYATLVDGNVGTVGKTSESIFDFDSLSIDLYLTESEEFAYLCASVWKDGQIRTTGLVLCTVQMKDGNLYFTNSNGFYLTGRRDDAVDCYWIEYSGRSFRLRPAPIFDIYGDWM